MNTVPLMSALEVVVPVLETGDDKQKLIAAKCVGLLRGYDHRWADAPYLIDGVESVMTSDLVNPKTNRKSRSFTIAGKLDVRATEIGTGAKILIDHKTTSDDISDLNAPYWRILVIEGQVSQYMLLEWLHGNRVDYGLWDVVRKPGICPKALSKTEAQGVLHCGEYLGYPLTDEELDSLRADGRETLMMYAERLAHDCIEERPDRYFQRRKVPRLDSELKEYADELWDHAQEILGARHSGRWPRNAGACFTHNSPCQYLGICSGYDTADSPEWKQRDWVHPELPQFSQTRGLEVLTNSRVKTFQTCRRKHQLRYELGIERTDEEEREAIFFGDLFHRALEQFFLALQIEQRKAHSNDRNSSSNPQATDVWTGGRQPEVVFAQ